MSDPLLEIENLFAGYGENAVLQGLSLSVEEASVMSLIGRNGVGKTTTLRSILGNVQPSEGTITFNGEDVTELSPEATVQRGIGLVPEERRVFPELSIRENIEIGRMGGTSDTDGSSVDELLSEFENLQKHEHNPGSSLSGGEQQMLAIARALASEPRLLLLDEPTEGLAPYIVRQVEEQIADLNEQGVTILLVEQNIEVALKVSDWIAIVDGGRVVYEGTPEDVENNEDVIDRHLGVMGIED